VTDPTSITLTTGTSSVPYDVVGTISFRYSSLRGILSDSLTNLIEDYLDGTSPPEERRSADYTFLFDDEAGDRAFEEAFLLTAQELRRRAGALGAHAVIAMKHDVDLLASDRTCLYLRVSGTAVRFRR
jgi:putative heavy-metal-binding protein